MLSIHYPLYKNLIVVFIAGIYFLSPGGGLCAVESSNNIRFERISVEQGLSQSGIHCILQDSKGFLWFGTWDGLNRYDGYDFRVFKNDPENPDSLSHNTVRTLCEDRRGRLWIGTEGGGLSVFDPRKETFVRYQHRPGDPRSLSHNVVPCVYEDSQETVWAGTEGGLCRFDRKEKKFIRYQHDPENPRSLSHNSVRSIFEDKTGVLWIGTEEGLCRFNREKNQFVRYLNDPDDPYSLSHNSVRSICEDRHGVLWIGTGSGLNRFDRKKGQFVRYLHDPSNPRSLSHNEIRVVYEDREECFWIGTEGGGLNRLNREDGTFIRYENHPDDPHSISHNVIWSVYEDRSGVLWAGTYIAGLNKFDRRKEQFIHYKADNKNLNSLSDNVVWSIYEDREGMIWIATDNGLSRLDRETNNFTHYKKDFRNPKSLSHNEVWSVYEDLQGTLWVGTFRGLNKLNRETGEFTRYMPSEFNSQSNKIRVICEDREGIFWVGTGDGLYQFDREREVFFRYQNSPYDPGSLSHNNIWSIYEDAAGTLWVGTEDGLNRFDREKSRFFQYRNDPNNPSSLSSSWVLSVYEDRSGRLWIGTMGGLNWFDREKNIFIRYREKDGLPNEVIYGILEDGQGNLWLSTNKGLSKFNPKTETFKNYEVKDGLQGNEFNVGAFHKNRKGEMFFGGVNGFNLFYPSEKDNPYLPSLVITDFRIFNETVPVNEKSVLQQSVSYTDEIELSYKERVFSFEFVALHFASPEKNQYAYKMEGFDETWIGSGTRRFVTYTNLPAGKYTFKVKGSNNDGLWNEEGIGVRIIVTPPPWKTWWAYTFYVSVVFGALLCYVRYKTKAQAEEIEQHRKELEQKRMVAELLEQKVKERTHDLNIALEEVRTANEQITDSLNYARLIQRSLLPNPDEVKAAIPNSFFIWMPRDIVGGDIFFFDVFADGFVIAVIDCTGHGVPGAFMTMIAFSGLKRIISDEKCHNPGEILKRLNIIVKTSLQQDTDRSLTDDGLDAGICLVRSQDAGGRSQGTGRRGQVSGDRGQEQEKSSLMTTYEETCFRLIFAGARLPLFYTLNDEIKVIKGDRQSIGYKRSDLDFEFKNHPIDVQKGMRFYMATDGFIDQIGTGDPEGSDPRRFGKKRFTELLRKNSRLPFEQQQEILLRTFDSFKGERERQDDMTVVGFGFE
jgi:ligand-binding sensor domain-containing protein/serine phosphatase RsbU (regulator of sigma subunit)